jgi:hypothetical protein
MRNKTHAFIKSFIKALSLRDPKAPVGIMTLARECNGSYEAEPLKESTMKTTAASILRSLREMDILIEVRDGKRVLIAPKSNAFDNMTEDRWDNMAGALVKMLNEYYTEHKQGTRGPKLPKSSESTELGNVLRRERKAAEVKQMIMISDLNPETNNPIVIAAEGSVIVERYPDGRVRVSNTFGRVAWL